MRRDRGAAVVTALLVVALCVTLVTTMFVQQQTSTRAVESRRMRQQTEMWQNVITTWAIAELQSTGEHSPVDHLGQAWAQPRDRLPLSTWIGGRAARSESLVLTGGDVLISATVEDAQARFNLKSLVKDDDPRQPSAVRPEGVAMYQRLLSSLSLDSGLAAPTAAYILRSLQQNGPIPITRTEDLLVIPGYSREIVERLASYVVMLPTATGVNMNTVGPEVLAAAIPGVSVSQAKTLIADRDRAYWRNTSDLTLRLKAVAPAAGASQWFIDMRSKYFLVIGEVRNGRAVRRTKALIYRDGIGVAMSTRLLWVREPGTEEFP